jgi:uncharacterized protein YjiK
MRRNFIASICLLSVLFCEIAISEEGTIIQDKADLSVRLDRYVLQSGPIKIGSIFANASGISSNKQSLFVVFNRPSKIVEFDLVGNKKRTIRLKGFKDPEGIAHIQNDFFAIVEEKRGAICIFKIKKMDQTIIRDIDAQIITIDLVQSNNKGLEGIAYDQQGFFYLAKEKDPIKIFKVPWLKKWSFPEPVSYLIKISRKSMKLDDLSDIFFHEKTGNLLLLSDESKCIVEITINGKEISRLYLKKSITNGLEEDIPQAEGIFMDEKRVLYICSEPNLLYVFKQRE